MKILEQAVSDYLYSIPIGSMGKDKRLYFSENARDFLFDDEYRLDWGEKIISPRDLLGQADLDIDYIRGRILKKLDGRDPLKKPLKRVHKEALL